MVARNRPLLSSYPLLCKFNTSKLSANASFPLFWCSLMRSSIPYRGNYLLDSHFESSILLLKGKPRVSVGRPWGLSEFEKFIGWSARSSCYLESFEERAHLKCTKALQSLFRGKHEPAMWRSISLQCIWKVWQKYRAFGWFTVLGHKKTHQLGLKHLFVPTILTKRKFQDIF